MDDTSSDGEKEYNTVIRNSILDSKNSGNLRSMNELVNKRSNISCVRDGKNTLRLSRRFYRKL